HGHAEQISVMVVGGSERVVMVDPAGSSTDHRVQQHGGVRDGACNAPTHREAGARRDAARSRNQSAGRLHPDHTHAAAGMRIEPPPSLPGATGIIPAATAAAAPPLDPPTPRVRSHGLRTGPVAFGSVYPCSPNSGVAVFPRLTLPAAS